MWKQRPENENTKGKVAISASYSCTTMNSPNHSAELPKSKLSSRTPWKNQNRLLPYSTVYLSLPSSSLDPYVTSLHHSVTSPPRPTLTPPYTPNSPNPAPQYLLPQQMDTSRTPSSRNRRRREAGRRRSRRRS